RVLRPGGEARIIVYNRSSLHYWLNQVVSEGLIKRGLFRERSMAGVLSAGGEQSRVDARPLVRVYSPRQLLGLLRVAGREDVRTRVRHVHGGDARWTPRLSGRVRAVRDPATPDGIGRRVGWYVVGLGTRRSG